jgi:hypothetical protein
LTTPLTVEDVFADRLRTLRKERGLDIFQLAAKCAEAGAANLTFASIQNHERPGPGTRARPRRHVAVKDWLTLANVLGVPPVALLLPLDTPGATVQLAPGVESPVEKALAWLTTPDGPDGDEPADLDPWQAATHAIHLDDVIEMLDRGNNITDIAARLGVRPGIIARAALRRGTPAQRARIAQVWRHRTTTPDRRTL